MAERRAHRPDPKARDPKAQDPQAQDPQAQDPQAQDPKAQALHARKIVRKLIAFDTETWHALRLLSRDSKTPLDALCEAAFVDLLKKHGRPVALDRARNGSPHRRGGSAARANPIPDGRVVMPALPALRARRQARPSESG